MNSERGKLLLVMESFTFSKDKVLKSGEVSWRCCKRSCKVRVYTLGPDNVFSRKQGVHDHEMDDSVLNRKILANSCKRKAQEDITERPSKIICQALSSNLPETLTTTDVNYVRKIIYNHRQKVLPGRLPKNIHEVHNIVGQISDTLLTSKKENFLFINDAERNIIVFTCETNLRVLSNVPIWYMDGTFTYCSKFFYQFFTIHVFENGYYVPLIYCLLPNKSVHAYETCFSLLKSNALEKYSLCFDPNTVFVDFEKSIHLALLNIWPRAKLNGCRFHLLQSWYRKIQSVGLSSEYKRNTEIGKWLKHTFGLTYLSPNEVEDCFVFDLMAYKPKSDLLDKYADYLLENYIVEKAVFPPSMWAENSASLTRTTNACESFHAKFNASFYFTHPSIHIFIQKLKECQTESYIKIQSLRIPNKIKDKNVKHKLECIEKLVNSYDLGDKTRLEYVKCISYLSAPK